MASFRLNFGPGTKISLMAVAAVGLWQWASQPQGSSLADLKARISPQKLTPLHKPEPRELLSRSLTPDQRRAVTRISQQWEKDKQGLIEAMNRESGQAPSRPDLASLKSGLAGYSELSRQYGLLRDRAWREALAAVQAKPSQEASS